MASGSSIINSFPENQLTTFSALWTFWKHEHCSGLVTLITADTACVHGPLNTLEGCGVGLRHSTSF